MTIIQLFEQPGSLSIFILGILAGFLLCWIFSLIRGKKAGAKENESAAQAAPSSATQAPGTVNAAVIAAISAAINEYRQVQGTLRNTNS